MMLGLKNRAGCIRRSVDGEMNIPNRANGANILWRGCIVLCQQGSKPAPSPEAGAADHWHGEKGPCLGEFGSLVDLGCEAQPDNEGTRYIVKSMKRSGFLDCS